MEMVRQLIDAVAKYPCTVFIRGESGSGKEVVARQVHARSDRAAGPFLAVDCTTLRDTLLESQLFGHKRGAFTGAERDTMGFFRAADGGTLFLDEVGELDLAVQAKLLRCIQDRAVVPLGDTAPVPVNVRVIAASHRDLQQMVDDGRFREDLYFRLDVVRLHVPPLRERLEDIPELSEHLLGRIAALYEGRPKTLSEEALQRLAQWHWPGNVRQLANALEHAFIMTAGDRIGAADLPPYVIDEAEEDVVREEAAPTPVEPLEDVMKRAVARALKATEGHQGQAAQLLQIERHRLYRMVKRYGLRRETRRGSA